MTLTPIYWLVAAVLALLYLPRVSDPMGRTRSMLKTLSVLALAFVALVGGGPVLLVIALIACAVGDAFLSRTGEGPLKAGMVAFAAGHLVYIALFLNLGGGVGAEPLRLALQVGVLLGVDGLGADDLQDLALEPQG